MFKLAHCSQKRVKTTLRACDRPNKKVDVQAGMFFPVFGGSSNQESLSGEPGDNIYAKYKGTFPLTS